VWAPRKAENSEKFSFLGQGVAGHQKVKVFWNFSTQRLTVAGGGLSLRREGWGEVASHVKTGREGNEESQFCLGKGGVVLGDWNSMSGKILGFTVGKSEGRGGTQGPEGLKNVDRKESL